MKIHGVVYIILGILMSLYSKFIQLKVQKSSLSLFFWVGIGFVVFGVFRLIINYVFNDKGPKKTPRSNPELERLKQEKDKMINNLSYNNKQIVACSRCGTKHYNNSNFCHMCGYSLK